MLADAEALVKTAALRTTGAALPAPRSGGALRRGQVVVGDDIGGERSRGPARSGPGPEPPSAGGTLVARRPSVVG